MRTKSTRPRMDVNLEELDGIIDAALRAPLSESDGQKLKTTLHAMAERLVRPRTTEKTTLIVRSTGKVAPPSCELAFEETPQAFVKFAS